MQNDESGLGEISEEPIAEFLKKKEYKRIPLSVNSIGHFEIDGLVNGVDCKFILDTGASGTVINNSDISTFNLMALSEDEDKAAGLGTTTLSVQKSKGNTIELNGFRISDWQLGIIDIGHVNEALVNKGAASINGVLGADIMNTFDAVIDYKDRALFLKENIAKTVN